jgi:MOSC domain-containing protein YiiM
MKLVSLNVGLPGEVQWKGKPVWTGIFKSAVTGPRMLSRLNVEGDAQADLTVHGGIYKAVYGYPVEHYDYWREVLPEMEWKWGAFGENFTTEGLLENQLYIGERFRIGTAELQVTEPRLPCYKLGIRFGRMDMVKRFLESRRTGFYFAVVEPGIVEADDVFKPTFRPTHNITIADITRVYAFEQDDLSTIQRIIKIPYLSEGWRDYFRQKLDIYRNIYEDMAAIPGKMEMALVKTEKRQKRKQSYEM